jgi:uncharacterized protein YjbI with pentapeptide repeats
MIYVFGLGIVGLVLFVWWFPKWQAKKYERTESEKKWEAENEFRKTIIQIVGGLIVIGGLFFAWEELSQSRDLLKQSHEEFLQSQENMKAGQISVRFTQAITLLSQDGATKRIGAIYALEQIAKESPNYLQTVLDILTSFVKNSEYFDQPVKEKEDKKSIAVRVEKEIEKIDKNKAMSLGEKAKKIAAILSDINILAEVQVALTVIGRIRYEVAEILLQEKIQGSVSAKKKNDTLKMLEEEVIKYRINLNNAILINADLREADLRCANLQNAKLQNAYLKGANLMGAKLQDADLHRAYLRASFQGADLRTAKLKRVDLAEANLEGADLGGAVLHEANLIRAELRHAKLQHADLERAVLGGAKLYMASLQGAKLNGARLDGAQLQEADLRGADLQGAYLQDANLSNTKKLTVDMLLEVKSLHGVKGLDPKIEEELRRRKPELFEKPKSD